MTGTGAVLWFATVRARERKVTVGSGTVAVRAPRVNHKPVEEESGAQQRYSSRILRAYARHSPKVEEVIPILMVVADRGYVRRQDDGRGSP